MDINVSSRDMYARFVLQGDCYGSQTHTPEQEVIKKELDSKWGI